MIRPLFTVCLVSVCVAAHAESATKEKPLPRIDDKDLVGCWFSTGTQGQPEVTIQGINNRSEDGSFALRFVAISTDGQLAYSNEAGYWAVNGSRYLTISSAVNGEPAVYPEVYNILRLDQQELSYRNVGTGNLFKSERVPCDTRLPRKASSH